MSEKNDFQRQLKRFDLPQRNTGAQGLLIRKQLFDGIISAGILQTAAAVEFLKKVEEGISHGD